MQIFHKLSIEKQYKAAFIAVIVFGLVAHMFGMTHNLLSSDSMFSIYADQNMITSGRWFLQLACGISSYYNLPWVNGCLSLFYLSIAAMLLVAIFDIKDSKAAVIISGLLVTFPALVSTFSYMYTADGYMLGILLAVLAVYLTKKYKLGFIFGGILLGFSIGIYQAYLAFAILVCIFLLLLMIFDDKNFKEIFASAGKMLAMGAIGAVFYYVTLQVLLKIQNKALSDYQGIDSMNSFSLTDLPDRLIRAIKDFGGFSLGSGILANQMISKVALGVLFLVTFSIIIYILIQKKIYRRSVKMLMIVFLLGLLPFATNVILLVSSEANNHLVMRMHWVLFLILPVIMISRYELGNEKLSTVAKYAVLLAGFILIFNNVVRANIAYFNMNERYEKTYAYCLRLVDRMEQTPGYYTEIPVMMIGVVDEGKYPVTDITSDITASMIGTTGDVFLYTGKQYQEFLSHYLNVTIQLLDNDTIAELYDTEEYREMDSFPAADSIKVVDDVLYIKTEPREETSR